MTAPLQSYRIENAAIPPALSVLPPGQDGWCRADVLIADNKIAAVTACGAQTGGDVPRHDAKGAILISAMVDCHTHLDKAHVAAFAPFPAGDLLSAIEAMTRNKQGWTADSLNRRLGFSLRSAYAYGVRALRSHVDFAPGNPAFVWEVMTAAQTRWRGRVEVQLCPLAGIANFADAGFVKAIAAAADQQGCLGVFLYDQPNLEDLLLPVFTLAARRGWDLDFHVDEGTDPRLCGLQAIIAVAEKTGFQGTILCGHCAALSQYPSPQRRAVIAGAKAAKLHFVSLPLSNLYLQSRAPGLPPTLRGMAPVAQLAQQGLTVSLGADNVRDGFCAFGDFDPLAVLGIGAQVGHLDEPPRDWISLITTHPARTLRLGWDGVIAAGAPADLVLLAARNSGEFNLRNTVERRVMRQGRWIDAPLPSFSDLNSDGRIDAS